MGGCAGRPTRQARGTLLTRGIRVHLLDQRLGRGDLAETAGACGVQNTPPGSAAPSLLARAELEGDDLEAALEVRRDLVQVWSLRETPHVFPGADLVVFIHGLLPWDEEGLRYFVRPSRTWTRRGWPPRSC